jgi:HK97 gp10 family phage protein
MNLTFQVQIKGDNNKDFRRILSNIGFAIEAEAKLLMTGVKTGREYRRRGRIHIASAPGESPAVDTGFLINSIQTDVKSDTETVVTIAAEYAEALEFGTENMAARPFVRPAIDSVLKRFDSGGFLGVET